jgi:hypothetical protein
MENIKLGFCSKGKNRAEVTLRTERVIRGASIGWKKPPSREDKDALRCALKKMFGAEAAVLCSSTSEW